jgi:hypothetical protein
MNKDIKTLAISLIKDDMINYKLVSALQTLGLDSLDYFVHLSTTVFTLMGFDNSEQLSDDVYQIYLQKIKRVKKMDIKKSHASLDALAEEIYLMLESKSPNRGAAQMAIVKDRRSVSRGKSIVAAA